MLAQTPPMGWNSWNTFGRQINEQVVKDTADAICALGLKDAGYEYVVIDDCWSLMERGADGRIVPDPAKFPSGMKALADYIHSKGLKFGMYACAGTTTCDGYPGSFDYEFIDAQTFADWEVDFLKYDYCDRPKLANGPILYNRMSMALQATGREILFSACNWGADESEKWIRSTGAHMYRSTGDICDNLKSFRDIVESQFEKIAYSAPGCYNDLDMLIVGMNGNGNVGAGGCTYNEYRMHFALWCLFQSPLMIGGDLSKMDDACIELLKNKELLSILKDPEARPPRKMAQQYPQVQWLDCHVFFKHLSNGEYILALFNFHDTKEAAFKVELYDLGITVASGYGFEGYEIFSGEKTKGVVKNFFETVVPTHDCKIFRLQLKK